MRDGERGWIRTSDPCLKRALLYQLSYAPTLIESNTFRTALCEASETRSPVRSDRSLNNCCLTAYYA